MRKASVPVAIGFVGLALVGALAAGPIMRNLTTDATPAIATATPASDTVQTASMISTATAEPDVEVAAEPETAPVQSTAAATQARFSGLDANDPRWNPDAMAVDEDKMAALKRAIDETVAAAEIATAMGNTEGLTTSGIPSSAAGFAPERPVLTSERSAFDAALVSEEEQVQAQPAVASSDLSPAKATQYVNMRAAPADDATVLTVVPANATIKAETDCRWCEVTYNGKTGYIFQSFIARN